MSRLSQIGLLLALAMTQSTPAASQTFADRPRLEYFQGQVVVEPALPGWSFRVEETDDSDPDHKTATLLVIGEFEPGANHQASIPWLRCIVQVDRLLRLPPYAAAQQFDGYVNGLPGGSWEGMVSAHLEYLKSNVPEMDDRVLWDGYRTLPPFKSDGAKNAFLEFRYFLIDHSHEFPSEKVIAAARENILYFQGETDIFSVTKTCWELEWGVDVAKSSKIVGVTAILGRPPVGTDPKVLTSNVARF